MKIFKNRKGFTLVELCVVMAIVGIVGTMVTTFIVYSSTQQSKITSEAQLISDTSEVQKSINYWIREYDSETYDFSVSGDKNTLTATAKDGSKTSNLYFKKDKVVEKVGAEEKERTDKLSFIKSLSFNQPESGGKKEQIIRLTVKYNNGEKQTLLFSLFSNVTRQRKVEGRK